MNLINFLIKSDKNILKFLDIYIPKSSKPNTTNFKYNYRQKH